MSLNSDEGPPEVSWRWGMSRADNVRGFALSLLGILLLVVFRGLFWKGVDDTPWYLLVELVFLVALCVAAALFFGFRTLDLYVDAVAVFSYKVVDRDPEVITRLVEERLKERGLQFWREGDEGRGPPGMGRILISLEDTDRLAIVVRRPRLPKVGAITVVLVESSGDDREAIEGAQALVDEALEATIGFDDRVISAIRRPRLVLYDHKGGPHKR